MNPRNIHLIIDIFKERGVDGDFTALDAIQLLTSGAMWMSSTREDAINILQDLGILLPRLHEDSVPDIKFSGDVEDYTVLRAATTLFKSRASTYEEGLAELPNLFTAFVAWLIDDQPEDTNLYFEVMTK